MANVGMPLQFSRMYNGPLDEKDVFESYEEALIYANSPIGYPGHVISVKTTEYRRDVYVINDDKSLSHVAVTRADIDLVLSADGWSVERPYSYKAEVIDLYEDDNVVVSMASDSTRDQYDAVINARISTIEQGDGYITFYCDEEKPKIDVKLRLVVGGLISAHEVPNSATVDTKFHTITINSDEWTSDNLYRVIVPDLTISDNAVVSVASNQTVDQINTITDADINVIEQGNGYIILKAEGTIPYLDFDITIAFGTNIVVVPDDSIIKSQTYSRNITLSKAGWILDSSISVNKYTQSFLLEGMTSDINGAILIPANLSTEELEALSAAEITLIQGDGSITFICNGMVPMFDITIGITYGNHVNILQSAPMFVDREALAQYSTFILYPEKWSYNEDIELYLYTIENITDLNETSNGYIDLANDITKDAEAEAILVELSLYDIVNNNILITAKEKPTLEIPVNLIFGSNVVIPRSKYFNNIDIVEPENILFENDRVPGNNLDIAMKYTLNQMPVSSDPSRTVMASVNNIPNGIIMKDAFNNNTYIMRLENGVMTTNILDSRLLPFFNGLKGIHYPLYLYKNLDKLEDNISYQYWFSLTGISNVVKSDNKLICYSIGCAAHGMVVIGTIEELLNDIPELCDYTVFDVKSNLYLRAYNGSLYYTGGLYEYPEITDFKVHGTIADRPNTAPKKGVIYYNTTTGDYYIWDGTSWVNMPTML